jgi:hypothetical protein
MQPSKQDVEIVSIDEGIQIDRSGEKERADSLRFTILLLASNAK